MNIVNDDEIQTYFKTKLNYELKKTSGNGNCLFHALAYFRYTDQNYHNRVREELTDFLMHNMHKYNKTIFEQDPINLNWLIEMKLVLYLFALD